LRNAIALSPGAAHGIIIVSLSLRACGITGEINGCIVAGEESTRAIVRVPAASCVSMPMKIIAGRVIKR